MTKLADVVECISDQCLPADAITPVYVGLEHIDGGALWLIRHGNPAEVQSAKSAFRKGDILYGKLRPYLDKAVLAASDGICSTDILVFRPRADMSGAYVAALLHFRPFREHAVSTTQGVNHPRTSWSALGSFEWETPPRPEQEKIAAVLWKVQKAMELQDKLVRTACELKAAAMRRLFTSGTSNHPTKETDFGPAPENWPSEPLGQCCHVQSGVTKGRAIAPSEAVEVPYLRVANVQDGHLDLREIKTIAIKRKELERYLLREGDVLLTEGGDFDKLGRGFIWLGQIPNCIHQNHIFAVRPDPAKLVPDFLAYLVQSPYGKAYFLTVAHKTTNLASINSTKLKALPVLIPPKDEQQEIARILKALDRKIALHERKRATLQELFQTLLHQLMTARVRVHDLDIDTSGIAA